MKYIWCLFILFMGMACEQNPSKPDAQAPEVEQDTPPAVQAPVQAQQATPAARPNCAVKGDILEGASFWFASHDRLIHLVADSNTVDPDFGPSYRVLVVQGGSDCQTLLRETLPVNFSPDYPYLLDSALYKPNMPIVCAQGFEFVYCYDLSENQLLPQMFPFFEASIPAEDAQSGAPLGLELWHTYLIGYAMDLGAYVFDLKDRQAPKVVKPLHFYKGENGQVNALFQLQNAEGQYQLVVPRLGDEGMYLDLMLNRTSPQPVKILRKSGANVLVSQEGEEVKLNLLREGK